jgi:hypothetical protein
MTTQGLKALSPDSKVFMTNYSGFDISLLAEFIGDKVKQKAGLVNIFPNTMSPKVIPANNKKMEEVLETFRPGVDYLMISGKGFPNFMAGHIMSDLFFNEEIDLLLFNPAAGTYYTAKWRIGD